MNKTLVQEIYKASETFKKSLSEVCERLQEFEEPLFDSELEVLIEILNFFNEINDKIKG